MTPLPQEIWQHFRTKGEYEIISLGKLQVNDKSLDMKECVVYKSLSDGKVWVRPTEDFIEKVTNEEGKTVTRFKKII